MWQLFTYFVLSAIASFASNLKAISGTINWNINNDNPIKEVQAASAAINHLLPTWLNEIFFKHMNRMK